MTLPSWIGSMPDFPEPESFCGPDLRPMPSNDPVEVERKERDWAALEAEARDFVQAYGAAAMLRCISEALK